MPKHKHDKMPHEINNTKHVQCFHNLKPKSENQIKGMETLNFDIPKANYHSTLDVPSNELNTLEKFVNNFE